MIRIIGINEPIYIAEAKKRMLAQLKQYKDTAKVDSTLTAGQSRKFMADEEPAGGKFWSIFID